MSETSSDRLLGRVKWFNNKAGYGFITVYSEGEFKDQDIFVHHTSLQVGNQQYKYLVQGEYIEMELVPVESATHKYQAASVRGINGGTLMCETRRDYRANRPASSTRSRTNVPDSKEVKLESSTEEPNPSSSLVPVVAEKKPRSAKIRGAGPRDGGDWTVVGKKKEESSATTRRGRPPKSAAVPADQT